MNSTLNNLLLPDLLEDLHDPGAVWQIGTLALCLLLGWLAARLVRARFAKRELHSPAVRFGVDSFAGVLAPLFSLILVLLAKPVLAHWHHVNLLRVGIALLASFVLIRIAFYIMRRVFARTGVASSSLLLFEKVFATLVWLGFALYITDVWQDILQYLEHHTLPLGRYKVSLYTILQAGISVLLTLIAALWIGAALEERVMRVETLHSSFRVAASRMLRAVLILVAVLLSLSLVGIDLTVLSVFGGALGVGLGLGLQKIASNYVSGFVILLDRSLSIGDLITVEKFSGRVTRINTRYTILQGLDGIDTVIPNATLLSSPVQNYSLTGPNLRLATQVAVAYGSDLEQILPDLADIARGMPGVLAEPAPLAVLQRFGSDGLELELGFWISQANTGRQPLLSNVNLAIWRYLQEKNISVPYPQREIRILNN